VISKVFPHRRFSIHHAYGDWMRPSFFYRSMRETGKKVGVHLPLYPPSIPVLRCLREHAGKKVKKNAPGLLHIHGYRADRAQMTHRETAHILAINWQDISHPLGGGAEVHLHEISKRLVQHGCQVTVLCSRYRDSAAEEEIDGVAIVRRSSRAAFNFAVPHAYRQWRRVVLSIW
jgi:hypothetical protein